MTRLLCAAREAVKHKSRSYVAIVKSIQIDHIEPAKPLLHNPAVLANYTKLVNAECDRLIKILESVQYLGEVSNSVEDRIIGKGENLSCIFMAALLQDRGIDAQYVDLSDVVPGDLSSALRQEVVACGKRIPVMTSFFKAVPGGLNDVIGKSFTDICAAPVAAGVGAQELQIWTEVDGFFTADPRRVPDARLIPSVMPSEATQLASQSSEDIEAFTINQVIRARIPVRIKNVMNPHGSGTMICLDDVIEAPSGFGTPATLIADCKGLVQKQSTFAFAPASHSKRPTAVTIKDRILVLNVHSNKQTRAHGFLMNIFRILEKWHLSVDLGSSSEVHVSMALNLDARPLSTDEQLQCVVEELNEYGNVDLVPDMTIISLLGHQLKNIVGISGTFFSVLGANDINIEMISQGTRRFQIHCLLSSSSNSE